MKPRELPFQAPYLYYHEKSDEAVYGATPIGQFNVDRFITSRPCWRQPITRTVAKPRTIVLADWTVKYKFLGGDYPSDSVELIPKINLITQLLENNFDIIYFDSDGKAITLTKENFDPDKLGDYFSNCSGTREALEESVVSQKKINKDKLFILDDVWMDILCSDVPEDISQPRILHVKEYCKLKVELKDSKKIKLIEDEIDRKYTHRDSNWITDAIKEIDKLKFIEVVLGKDVFREDNFDRSTPKELTDFRWVGMSYKDFIDNKESSELLGKKISKILNLISISFHDVKLGDVELERKLNKIEILDANIFEINSSGIENVLSCMPGLRKIKFTDLIINGSIANKFNLSKLTTLDLKTSLFVDTKKNRDAVNASFVKFIASISRSENLRKLVLTNVSDDVAELISKIKFPALTEIAIYKSSLTIASVNNLISAYPNIKKLIVNAKDISFLLSSNNISNIVIKDINDEVIDFLLKNKFTSLEKITLKVNNLKLSSLNKLILILPSLNVLDVEAKTIEDDVDFVNTSKSLKVLKIQANREDNYSNDILTLSDSCTEKILKMGVNISELNVSYVKQTGKINPDLKLPNLKKISLDKSALDYSVIETTIKKSQENIEFKVNDSECDIKDIKKSLKNVTNIEWMAPPKEISEFISASTNLKRLYLSNYYNNEPDIWTALSKVPELEVLELMIWDIKGARLDSKLQYLKTFKFLGIIYQNKISYESMIAILDQMPNLLNLELKGIKWSLPSEKKQKDFCNYLKSRGINYNEELEYAPKAETNVEQTFSPDFDAASKIDYRPKAKFAYTNVDNKSQLMIMDRLGWFIEKKYPDYVKYLDRSANGICHAPSTLFIDKDSTQWNHFLNKLQSWNGDWMPAPDRDTLDSLNEVFEAWKKIYVQSGGIVPGTCTFFGDGLESFLRSSEGQKRYFIRDNKFILSNPWHSCALKFSSKADPNHWKLYDPNYTDGYKIFPLDKISDLILAIEKSLGNVVGLSVSSLPAEMVLSMPSQFVSDGGLMGLPFISNTKQVLDILQKNIDVLPILSLQNGLFVRANSGEPAFFVVLSSENNEVALYTIKLLNKLMQHYQSEGKSFSSAVRDSMDCIKLSGAQGNELITKLIQLQIQINKEWGTHDYDKVFDVIINALPIEHISKEKTLIEEKKIEKIEQIEQKETPDIRRRPLKQEKETVEVSRSISAPQITKEVKKVNIAIEERKKRMGRLLETWVREPIESPTTFLQEMCSISTKSKTTLANNKRLVEFISPEHVKIFLQATQQHCQSIHRPVFYVHSPEDLICSAPFIERKGDKGWLKKGPGGRLHEFLSQQFDKDNPPIILVNYDRFTSEDIVRFNGLLDKAGNADGTKLHDLAIVLGARNKNKPGCYQGMDYYSRFTSIKECPATIHAMSVKLTDLSIHEKKQEIGETIKINLFQGDDWKEKLEGQWIIHGKELRFKEGLLAAAIKSGKPIEIQNGPWNNSEFVNYWEQAILTRRIEHSGGIIKLPDHLELCKTQGYAKQLMLVPEQVITGFAQSALNTINPGNFSQYFVNYECIDGGLETKAGIIAANTGKDLHVNITRDLNVNQWAELLQECEDHQVKLICHRADQHEKILFNPDNKATTSIIESTDIDVTVKLLTEKDKWIVIDITDCEPPDLLVRLDAKINDKMEFEFSEKINVLKRALDEGKNIILKGHPSETLTDVLASIMFQRGDKENTSRISIVCDDASGFSSLPVQKDEVKPETKKRFLAKKFGDSLVDTVLDKLDKEEYAALEARLAYRQRMSDQKYINDDDAWCGMKRLPGGIDLPPFNPEQSAEITQAFIQERREGVKKVLENSPYVFLTGLTGVGKSTFVEQDLIVDKNDRLYKGESALEAFAKETAPGKKYLFIDEANVTSRSWSEFEGLFDDPPGLLINGTYFPLDKEAKVIFAGNPVSYGDRAMASFFARHGNALVFNPLPTEFIYEKIIKPVFNNARIPQDKLLDVAKHCLEVYQYICKQSVTEVLISPREVQMMALLTLSHMERHPTDNIVNVARHYASVIGRQVLPDLMKNNFDKQFPLEEKIAHATIKEHGEGQYLITPSRQPVIDLLSDTLSLCEARQTNPDQNDAQQYGGLGGIIIEGEPGIGKSELVMSVLKNRGYQRVTLQEEKIPDKAFYYMPVTMPTDQKKELLLKAFHQGAKVVIDEINSSPMMERLLNDLLMGKSPDGKRPEKPGFMIIGTQNPATMAGRREASKALARRLITTVLPPNTMQEMVDILVHKDMQSEDAKLFVDVYQEKSAEARAGNLKPAPTFRDLLRKADEFVEHIGSEAVAEMKESLDLSVPDGGHSFRLFAKPEQAVPEVSPPAHTKKLTE